MMHDLTPYERETRGEIERWRDRKDSALSKTLRAATVPVEWIYEKVTPDSVRKTFEKAVIGSLEALQDASRWTYSDVAIIRQARKIAIDANQIEDLREADFKRLDQLARRHFKSNKLLAALEGGGCGMGGLALIAADIPLLFTVSLRAVQQIGSCYGFDMEDPSMRPVVFEVFGAASAASAVAKTRALADMRIAATALAKNWTYKAVAERTQTGVIAQALKEATRRLPKDIARNVTKRKLAQAIPVVGAVVGAGFNYWFLSSVTESAYMLFRELHLAAKYADGPDC